jgi:hypothetical protein
MTRRIPWTFHCTCRQMSPEIARRERMMDSGSSDTHELIHRIRHEGPRAVRLMRRSQKHTPEEVVVLLSGTVPSVRNLVRRKKAQAFPLTNGGMFFIDHQTGQPYMRSVMGTMPYCVPIDLEHTERPHLVKLLRRIRRCAQECQ